MASTAPCLEPIPFSWLKWCLSHAKSSRTCSALLQLYDLAELYTRSSLVRSICSGARTSVGLAIADWVVWKQTRGRCGWGCWDLVYFHEIYSLSLACRGYRDGATVQSVWRRFNILFRTIFLPYYYYSLLSIIISEETFDDILVDLIW